MITGISVAGVTVGVAALVVVLSVMNGFYDFVREMLVSVDPHIRVERVDGALANPDSVIRVVTSVPHVVSASSFVEGKALLMHEGGGSDVNKVVIVRGVEADNLDPNSEVLQRTLYGAFDLERRDGRPGVVVGLDLSSRLGLAPVGATGEGSRVELLSAMMLERMISQIWGATTMPQRFEIRGIYDLQSVSDESTVFVDIEEARHLFRMDGGVSSVEARLDDVDRAADVKSAIERRLPHGQFRVLTWYDLQRTLYDVMALEKWAASAILVLIVVVAAFNIVGSLTMVVIEKRRDVGALRAMGATKKDIRRIFVNEGILIGLVGTSVGLALGLALVGLQAGFELVPMAGAESFLIDAYPVAVRWIDIAGVAVVAMGLCVGASIYPSRRAAHVEPAAALRAE